MRTGGIDYDSYFLFSLQQPEGRGLYRAFGSCAEDDELIGPQLAEEPVQARFLERVNAALLENDLAMSAEYVPWQIRAAVGSEGCAVFSECIAYFLLAGGAVNAESRFVVARIDLCGGDYADIIASGPSGYSTNIAQDAAVIAYTHSAVSGEEVLLRVNVYEYASATEAE